MYQEIWQEFRSRYKSDEDCVPFLERMKWPTGFSCNGCGHRSAYKIITRSVPLYECRKCRYQQSLTSHTIMHKSRTSLRKWLFVFYLVGKSEHSVNAVQLSELINITYKTAWSMLNKIRSLLSGDSEQHWGNHVEIKHEVFNQQSIPTEARLVKERSVAIIKSVHAQCSFVSFYLLSRKGVARDNLIPQEQTELRKQLNLDKHPSVHVNPRFQQFLKRNLTEERVVFGQLTRHPLSEIAIDAFNWMKDKFHGVGDKYAQSYMDEYCLRWNASTGVIKCAFEHVTRLSLRPL
ncbi:transposase [Paenibacillus paeoniae]|nr:transposase [Paenibacillus paeoniae]